MHPFGEGRTLLFGDKLLDGDQQRRVADEPGLPVDHFGELVQRLHAVARPGLGQRSFRLGPWPCDSDLSGFFAGQAELVAELGEHLLDVHAGVPHVEVALAASFAISVR